MMENGVRFGIGVKPLRTESRGGHKKRHQISQACWNIATSLPKYSLKPLYIHGMILSSRGDSRLKPIYTLTRPRYR